MAEVIEAGRPDRPRRGWVAGVVAVLLLGAVGYGATRSPDGREEARPAPTPSSAPTSSPPPTELELEGPEGEPLDDPYEGAWTLPALGERTGVEYLASGDELRLVDVDSGDVAEVGLADRGSGYLVEPLARTSDGLLVIRRSLCGGPRCLGEAFLLEGGRATKLGGDAVLAFPAGDGTVWVVGAEPSTETFRPEWVELRRPGGARVGPRTRLASGDDVRGATPRGLVVTNNSDHEFGERVYVFDPRSRRRDRLVGDQVFVTGVDGSRITWVSNGCQTEPFDPADCTLSVTDTATGRVTEWGELPAPVTATATSPDGRYLAVAFSGGIPPSGVLVIDTRTRRRVPVGGLTFPPMAASVSWSPDSRWLVVAGPAIGPSPEEFERQVAVWRPGLRRAYAGVPVRSQTHDALVVTAPR